MSILRKTKTLLCISTIAYLVWAQGLPAHAQLVCPNYTGPRSTSAVSGDLFYEPRVSNADISRYVGHFDMDSGNWNGSFGWNDPGNADLPFARALHGIKALENSTPPGADPSLSWLAFGYNYSRGEIDELDGSCNTSAVAYSQWGLWDNWTSLRPEFFFDLWVPERAGVLIHEARHAEGWGSVEHTSCDGTCKYSPNGCDPGGFPGSGGWTYQIAWLADFYRFGVNTTMEMKGMAKTAANDAVINSFCFDSGHRF